MFIKDLISELSKYPKDKEVSIYDSYIEEFYDIDDVTVCEYDKSDIVEYDVIIQIK